MMNGDGDLRGRLTVVYILFKLSALVCRQLEGYQPQAVCPTADEGTHQLRCDVNNCRASVQVTDGNRQSETTSQKWLHFLAGTAYQMTCNCTAFSVTGMQYPQKICSHFWDVLWTGHRNMKHRKDCDTSSDNGTAHSGRRRGLAAAAETVYSL